MKFPLVVLLFAFVCVASGGLLLIDDRDYGGNVGHIQSRSNRLEERRRVREILLLATALLPLHMLLLSTEAEWVQCTPSSRPTLRPTSSGASGTGLELSTEDKEPSEILFRMKDFF